jgi:ABC-type multidrug transport system fused ATPase/permease subunit
MSSAADTFGALIATPTAHLGKGSQHRLIRRGRTLRYGQSKAISMVRSDLRNDGIVILNEQKGSVHTCTLHIGRNDARMHVVLADIRVSAGKAR